MTDMNDKNKGKSPQEAGKNGDHNKKPEQQGKGDVQHGKSEGGNAAKPDKKSDKPPAHGA